MRILLIDDSPNDRELAAREIRRVFPQAELVKIGSPEEVDLALAADNFVLCVVDYSMGWTNGPELLKRIRAREPDCPVILFTGSLGDEGAADAIKAGFDDYILKSPERLPRLSASAEALLKQRADQQATRRAEARYRTLFKNTTVGLFACASDGRVEDANDALLRQLNLPDLTHLRGRSFLDFVVSAEVHEAWHKMLHGVTPDGITGLEVQLRVPRGAAWGLLDALPVDEGRTQIEGVLTKVTPLKEALEQRSALLGEVYHRVHNNLQIVQSLIAFQSRRFSQPEVREAFDMISGRIQALSLVQQRLYQAEDYAAVDFSAYLRSLVEALLGAHGGGRIAAMFEVEQTKLHIDKAMPLGLMANELLTNVIKHAFPDGRPGEIRLAFRQEGDDVLLVVSDNGVGTVARDAEADNGGMGTRLVPRLARQLGAEVTTSSDAGYSTTIRFRL